jgi:hypothetical protein
MKIVDVELVIGKYIKDVVLPVMPSSLMKFALATGSVLVMGKTEKLIQEHMKLLQSMEIIDQDGNVDIEALYKAAKEGIKATGGKIEIKGLIFNEQDIDKLYSMMRGQ